MRILLLGEASYVHNYLKKGLQQLGHEVVHVSAGNNWHNSPRDIDIRRNMKWGPLGGLWVLWRLLRNYKVFVGNDVVQMNHYSFLPLRPRWSAWFVRLLARYNKVLVMGCWGDDPQVFSAQAKGVPEYSDTHIYGRPVNVEENRERIAEQELKECVWTWRDVTKRVNVLVPCLYEYYLNYDEPEFRDRLHYVPLPIDIAEEPEIKGCGKTITVLVGIQKDRDYMKGASVILRWLETVAAESDGKIVVRRVENVPYKEYCQMLEEADVLVDQLYSYTPSMNSLAAMARGTVVIGGGEEDYYAFIGEEKLRPIINVRPEQDEDNLRILREALLTPGRIAELSRQSIEFVRKYHELMKVARDYEQLYIQALKRA